MPQPPRSLTPAWGTWAWFWASGFHLALPSPAQTSLLSFVWSLLSPKAAGSRSTLAAGVPTGELAFWHHSGGEAHQRGPGLLPGLHI